MVQNQHHQSTTSPITNILFVIHKSSQFFKIHESLHISPRTRPCSAYSQFAILDPLTHHRLVLLVLHTRSPPLKHASRCYVL